MPGTDLLHIMAYTSVLILGCLDGRRALSKAQPPDRRRYALVNAVLSAASFRSAHNFGKQHLAEGPLIEHLDAVPVTLKANEEATLMDFGHFRLLEKGERVSLNPTTGQSVPVPARRIAFRPASPAAAPGANAAVARSCVRQALVNLRARQ